MNATAQSNVLDQVKRLLHAGILIESEYADGTYELDEMLGIGGFGIAYKALNLTTNDNVCLKITAHQDSWHQEAYYGSLLRGNARTIQMLDRFPFKIQMGIRSLPLFVSVFELAAMGPLGHYLARTGPWPEDRARREIIALLRVLTELHAGGTMHRDITPMNVLVNYKGNLKLHDFGIARQRLLRRSVPADAFNIGFVSNIKRQAGRRQWLMADDVFQMGQLLARGDGVRP